MASTHDLSELGVQALSSVELGGRQAFASVPVSGSPRVGAAPTVVIDPASAQRAELIAPMQLFAGLPRQLLERIADGAQTLRIASGSYVFKSGETHKGFYVVVYGKVQLLLPNTSGEAKVLAVMERGMSFGEAAMFMGIPFPVSARASDDTMVIFVPQDTLNPVLASRPAFALQMLARMSRRLHNLVQDIAAYTQKNARNRVAAYLFEQVQQGDKSSVRLPDRKQAIASQLSVAPETFSRTLRQLQEDSVIRVSGYEVKIIDMKRLEELAGA